MIIQTNYFTADISALQDAAEAGDLSIVKLLADKGAEINAENSDGLTALHKASGNGHTQVINGAKSARLVARFDNRWRALVKNWRIRFLIFLSY